MKYQSVPHRRGCHLAASRLWIAFGVSLLLAAVLEFSGLDLWLQDKLFDRISNSWLVDSRSRFGKAAFYTGPKILLVLFAVSLLGLVLGPSAWRRRFYEWGWYGSRIRLVLVISCAACIPLTIAVLKSTSNVSCPSELRRYGGTAEYRRPFSGDVLGKPTGRCWPAGHASGGFSLLALLLLARRRSRLVQSVRVATLTGWAMGTYQTLKGAHFVSHTVVTMAIAFSIVAIFSHMLTWLIRRPKLYRLDAVK